MKMICDIPDEVIKSVRTGTWCGSSVVEKMIANGTPLPKGHGRLIDADELDVTIVTTDDYSGNEVLDVVLKDDIDDASTIIEADTESEE